MKDYSNYSSKGPQRQRGQVPGWAWLVVGMMIGLFAAFLYFLQQGYDPDKIPPTAQTAPNGTDTRAVRTDKPAQAPKVAKKDDDGLSFDFYNMLRDYEVVIPEEESSKPLPKGSKANEYMVQVGSFQAKNDAESRKANLAMLGLMSDIRAVKVQSTVYHRVQLGPYQNERELDKVKRILQDNDIEFLLTKKKT